MRAVEGLASPSRPVIAVAAAASAVLFVAVGALGVYRYLDNYWLYRGFPPPRDPAFVLQRGTVQSFRLASPALGGRRQEVVVYLPPGYDPASARRYPVFYLLHGVPGRPRAFLETVRAGVVQDIYLAKHLGGPMILVMPSGSPGTFTDEEWANGVRPGNGWETFVARDLVRAIDARFRTIPAGAGRAIGGLSEGGYGALNIAFHHPREFRVIESWSGYEKADNLRSIFGGRPALLRRNSPVETLASGRTHAPAGARLRLVLLGEQGLGSTGRTAPSRVSWPAIASPTATSWCEAATTGRSGAARRCRRCSPRPGISPVRRVAVTGAALVAGLAVTIAATGWLYVVQPRHALPGPAIGDSLPLDELSRRSAVPLLVFVGVWAAAAFLLGLIARAARVERLTAALLLAAGVGAWSYLTAGVSILVVRQIPRTRPSTRQPSSGPTTSPRSSRASAAPCSGSAASARAPVRPCCSRSRSPRRECSG